MKKLLLFLFFFSVTFLNVAAAGEYAKSIKVDGTLVSGFASDKLEYELKYDSKKEKVNIVYEYDTKEYIGSGSGNMGDIALSYGTREYSFTLTNTKDANDKRTYVLKITRADDRTPDNSLESLTVAGQKVSLSDKNDYDVYVDSKLEKAEILAKVKDANASFVSGYGERTGNNQVTLSGEKTTVEVRVKALNDAVRKYVINIIKKDYKSSDSTLKTLSIDKVNFDFKANVYEYNISVKNEVSEIVVSATPTDSKAKVEYDQKVTLKNGVNEVLVKVIAEDSKESTYKLNITREEEVPIVSDIKITGVDFKFDPKTYDYEIKTAETKLEIKVTLSKEEAEFKTLNNENLKSGSIVTIEASEGEQKVSYRFKIAGDTKKEEENEAKVVAASKNNNDFMSKYEFYIALFIFATGILSLVVALLTKPKK